MSIFKINSQSEDQSEDEQFIRRHCLFVIYYAATKTSDDFAVFCSASARSNSRTFASGLGATKEEAWAAARRSVTQHLAYLQTLFRAISEIDNSNIEHKEFLSSLLRLKFEKLGRGVIL